MDPARITAERIEAATSAAQNVLRILDHSSSGAVETVEHTERILRSLSEADGPIDDLWDVFRFVEIANDSAELPHPNGSPHTVPTSHSWVKEVCYAAYEEHLRLEYYTESGRLAEWSGSPLERWHTLMERL